MPTIAGHLTASSATPLQRLGSLPVGRFMREYWQRRPVLLRQALGVSTPSALAAIDAATLFRLASDEAAEARLISHSAGRWQLRHGPFAPRSLPPSLQPSSRARWTLLVQGVDLLHPPAAQLLRRFRFVPDARLDDLMVSYASDGGGVGPHVDSYDVFLLQVHGRRRWRISRQRDHALVPGLPLKILRDFRPTQEWVLEPGDMLYLPPGVAHEGVAVGPDCITASIGFRAPTYAELLGPWLDAVAARAQLRGQYRDPGQPATREPARLPPRMLAAVTRALAAVQPGRAAAREALLAHLSEPKAQVVFDRPRAIAASRWQQQFARRGVHLDARTRLLYDGVLFGCNGEVFRAEPAERRALMCLANHHRLAPVDVGPHLISALSSRVHEWYHAGWVHLI